MISFISSFKITYVIMPDPNIFFRIAASVANADADNPNGIKTLLANGLSTSFSKSKPVFYLGPRILSKSPLDCPILCS